MAALDLTSFQDALKIKYSPDNIRNMVYKDHPLLAALPKMEDFGGKQMDIHLIWGNPLGRSATFATAQANKAPGKYESFSITRVHDYGLASLDNETIKASVGDANAFLRAAVVEVDGVLQAVTNSLARALYRSGTGSIGVVGSIGGAGDTVLTLATPADIVNFEVGMTIVSSGTDGSALNGAGEARVVTAVDRDAGTISCAAADSGWLGVASLGTGDFLYVQGDAQDGGSSRTKVSGLAAWIPSSAPGATAFFGVDRSVDVTRLGGIRVSGVGLSIEEAVLKASARAYREGARPDVVFCNPEDFLSLVLSMGSRVTYDVVRSSDGKVGFESVVVFGASGKLKVTPDPDCPKGTMWMLTISDWKLCSLGAAPQIITTGDDLKFLRESAADAVEIRTGYYAQLACHAPGRSVRIALV